MNTKLLYIHTLFGLSIEVYYILIILGIPTFYLWRTLSKKIIKLRKNRIIATWLATIILTPIIYIGIISLIIFSISYYPSHDFDKQKWLSNEEERYELSDDLIKSKILIGKTKTEIRQMLGDVAENNDTLNIWFYGLGTRPELFNIDPDYLSIVFKHGIVTLVEQHRR